MTDTSNHFDPVDVAYRKGRKEGYTVRAGLERENKKLRARVVELEVVIKEMLDFNKNNKSVLLELLCEMNRVELCGEQGQNPPPRQIKEVK